MPKNGYNFIMNQNITTPKVSPFIIDLQFYNPSSSTSSVVPAIINGYTDIHHYIHINHSNVYFQIETAGLRNALLSNVELREYQSTDATT